MMTFAIAGGAVMGTVRIEPLLDRICRNANDAAKRLKEIIQAVYS